MIGYVNELEDQARSSALMTATNLNELNQLDKDLGGDNTVARGDALIKLASQYDELVDEIEEYNKVIAESGEDSEEAKIAQKELSQAIRKSEWKKFTKEAKDAAKALKDLTNPSEIEENLITIQKAFKNAFGMNVSIDQLEKFSKEFAKWGNATEEESDDIATHIYSMLNFNKAFDDGGNFTEAIKEKLNKLEKSFDITITKDEIMIDDNLDWYCPNCGNRDKSKMNVVRRTCGYLGEKRNVRPPSTTNLPKPIATLHTPSSAFSYPIG